MVRCKNIFEKPIICKTVGWTRTAWTQNGLNDLRRCAAHQKFRLIETEVQP